MAFSFAMDAVSGVRPVFSSIGKAVAILIRAFEIVHGFPRHKQKLVLCRARYQVVRRGCRKRWNKALWTVRCKK